MLKWFVISLLVILVFISILLGLGKLLHDNEQRVTQVKAQRVTPQSVQQVTDALADESSSDDESTALDNRQKIAEIITTNLTCVNDQQCVVVDAQFTDVSCQLAINTIGAAILAKASLTGARMGSCPTKSQHASAVCHANVCLLQISD